MSKKHLKLEALLQQRTCQKVNEDFSKQMWSSRISEICVKRIRVNQGVVPVFFKAQTLNINTYLGKYMKCY